MKHDVDTTSPGLGRHQSSPMYTTQSNTTLVRPSPPTANTTEFYKHVSRTQNDKVSGGGITYIWVPLTMYLNVLFRTTERAKVPLVDAKM